MVIGMEPRLVEDPIRVVVIPKEVSLVVRVVDEHVPQGGDVGDDLASLLVCLPRPPADPHVEIHPSPQQESVSIPHIVLSSDCASLTAGMCLARAVERLQNLKTVRRNVAAELTRQILLLLTGIRTAYLLDLCQVSAKQLHEMVAVVSKEFPEARSHLLILEISTGDHLILNVHKLLPLLSNCLENHEVVDISRSPARLLNSEEKRGVQEFLEDTLRELKEFCVSLVTSSPPQPPEQRVHYFYLGMEPNAMAGYEFLAGWLLSYPVVYNCPLLPSPETGVLSMQELQKFSLFVTLRSAEGEQAEEISVQEFTIPRPLLPAVQSHLQEQLHRMMSATLSVESWRGWDLKWSLREESVTSPAVVF